MCEVHPGGFPQCLNPQDDFGQLQRFEEASNLRDPCRGPGERAELISVRARRWLEDWGGLFTSLVVVTAKWLVKVVSSKQREANGIYLPMQDLQQAIERASQTR